MDIGVAEIRKWHLAKGWLDVGYHYVIRRNGEVEYGRPNDVCAAHAEGFNHCSLGICLVGGVAEEDKVTAEQNFTPEQYAALLVLLHGSQLKFPDTEILGHRDLKNVRKDCPSFDVRAWLATEPY